MDVQAERLRELAEAATPGPWIRSESRPWVVTAEARNGFDLAYCGPKPPDPSPLRAEHDAAFIAACDPQTVLALLDLLAGQAEQIERLERERDEARLTAKVNASLKNSVSNVAVNEIIALTERAEAAVRQRDNLRDAAEAACIGLECAVKVHSAVVMDTPEDERIKADAVAAMQLAHDLAREALRADAVGEGGQDA